MFKMKGGGGLGLFWTMSKRKTLFFLMSSLRISYGSYDDSREYDRDSYDSNESNKDYYDYRDSSTYNEGS